MLQQICIDAGCVSENTLLISNIAALFRGCKPRMPLFWPHLRFLSDHWWIQIRQFRKICHFRIKNPQLSTCLFCHVVLIFAKLINSCQICYFRKIVICQDATFFHLIWIFGRRLDDFVAYAPFLPKFPFFAQNLPFSYNRRLSRFPSLSPHLRFCKTFDGFLPFSWKLPAANGPLLLSHLNFLPDLWWILAKFANSAKYVIFVKPTIIGMPLFSSSFN